MGKSLTFFYSVIQKCGIIPVVFNVVGGHCRVTANQKSCISQKCGFLYILFYTELSSLNFQIESKRSTLRVYVVFVLPILREACRDYRLSVKWMYSVGRVYTVDLIITQFLRTESAALTMSHTHTPPL
jgi:hypothetical protein